MTIEHTHTSQRLRYADAHAQFSLAEVEARFSGDFKRGINACVECCDRHAEGGRIGLRCVDEAGTVHEYSFDTLCGLSAKAAHVFQQHGVQPGDVVAGLLPRTLELILTILGTWRLGAVYQPLFTAFGSQAVAHRLRTSAAKLVVTDTANRSKLDTLEHCPKIAMVRTETEPLAASDFDFRAELETKPDVFVPVMLRGDDLFMLLSTSGTTGMPKGVPVPLRAMSAFSTYMRSGIELKPSDVFWNIADPGWAYGLYYAICGPLLLGHATTLYRGDSPQNPQRKTATFCVAPRGT